MNGLFKSSFNDPFWNLMTSSSNLNQKTFWLNFIGIYLLLLAVLGFLVSSWYSLKSTQELELIKLNQSQVVSRAKSIMLEEYESMLSDLLTLASLPLHSHSRNTTSEHSFKQDLVNTYLVLSQTRGRYDQIRYIDKEGMEKVRVDYNDGTPSLIPQSQLQNKKTRYYFQDINQLSPTEIYISRFDLNIEQGKIEQPYKPIIRMGKAIFNERGQRQGILLLNYLGKVLLSKLNRLRQSEGSQLMIVDQMGYWLKHPNPDKEWGFMFQDKQNQTFAAEHPKLWQTMLTQHTGQITTPQGLYSFESVFPLKSESISELGHYQLRDKQFSTQANLKNYQWLLISYTPRTYFTQKLKKQLQNMASLLIGIIVLMGGIAFLFASNRHQKQLLQKKARYLAYHDSLTGLYNRYALTQTEGQHNLLANKSDNDSYSVFFLDLDGFKPINDTYGHQVGDQVLQTIASRLKNTVRKEDIVVRVGGDEFAIITYHTVDRVAIQIFGDRLIKAIEKPIQLDDKTLHLGTSIGIASYPQNGDTLNQLIDLADAAMYKAKKSGKGKLCFA